MNLEISIKKRHSHRLKGYDYSKPGNYYITICSYDRNHIFGNCEGGKVKLSPIGKHTKICINKINSYWNNV
jgi:hypothetical protein